ncbi:MAG: protein translocase subunit SecF [Dethiobacter sp.]|jgi:preprotein translocase SecF subunit|nr:protein translocase subunit SecF [Dethiobacter sp.]
MRDINFVALRKYAFTLSALLIIVGIISMMTVGLNLGIDFTGGTLIHYNIGQEFTVGEVREVLAPFGLDGATVQKVGFEGMGESRQQEVLIRTPALSPQEQDDIFTAFQQRFNLSDSDLLRVESVGAIIGSELQRKAFWALLIASIGMVIYITFRFEYRYALTAIAALLHDAMIVLAFFSVFRLEINSPFVAAILTIIGYSINDTIVIFDRIRENMKNRRKETMADVVNNSIKGSLTRSINTSATTLFVLVTLFAFGGVTLRPFISALLVGVLTGTYSSIFIASPLWLAWKERDNPKKVKVKAA